jgi:hypothetical protein
MTMMIRILVAIALLGAGAAVGFPIGQYEGFSRGSEWAMVQADIVAREAGVFMPVRFEEEQFHVVLQQPKGLYTRTRRLAAQQGGEELLQISERGPIARSGLPETAGNRILLLAERR